ncbi:Uncharacterised protein [Mycobacteroides abscessus subsp. abscessus]|nr:Uncharacterised protein [Mycobacteroides abscessus subsp. abscessus]
MSPNQRSSTVRSCSRPRTATNHTAITAPATKPTAKPTGARPGRAYATSRDTVKAAPRPKKIPNNAIIRVSSLRDRTGGSPASGGTGRLALGRGATQCWVTSAEISARCSSVPCSTSATMSATRRRTRSPNPATSRRFSSAMSSRSSPPTEPTRLRAKYSSVIRA